MRSSARNPSIDGGSDPAGVVGVAFEVLLPSVMRAPNRCGDVDVVTAAAARARLADHVWSTAQRLGAAVVEMAVVSCDGGSVALLGPSGSGKSMRSLVARERGWTVLTDEAGLVVPGAFMSVGARGQSRSPLTGASRFGERWLFDTAPARTVPLEDFVAIVVLGEPVPGDIAGRLRLTAALSGAPGSTHRDAIALLGEFVCAAPWFDERHFDELLDAIPRGAGQP